MRTFFFSFLFFIIYIYFYFFFVGLRGGGDWKCKPPNFALFSNNQIYRLIGKRNKEKTRVWHQFGCLTILSCLHQQQENMNNWVDYCGKGKNESQTCKFGLLADKRPVSVLIFSEQWIRPFLPDTWLPCCRMKKHVANCLRRWDKQNKISALLF